MMNKGSELKIVLDKFDQLIESAPDDKSSLANFVNFLRGFLRTRDPDYSLPSAEIMTIIKN